MRSNNISSKKKRMFPEKDSATVFIFVFITLWLMGMAESSMDPPQFECSKTCVVENCNTIVMKYGKYCGVGWSGCLGEKPCDDLDACCQVHDQCVDQYGMASIECHEECRRCVKKVEQSGKLGFSKSCPYDVAVPTLVQCMDVSIMLSQYDVSGDDEL